MGMLEGKLGDMLGSMMGPTGGTAGSGNLQGMLGGLLGQMGSSGNSQSLIASAMTLLQQQGGLEGLVAKFRANGLGSVVDSWVGTGANQPVSSQQLQQVLGNSTLSDVASQIGTSPEQAAASLSSVLPELVNSLTPNGHIPTNSNDLVSQGLSMLQGKLGGIL